MPSDDERLTRIDLITIFPDMLSGFFNQGVVGRAVSAGHIDLKIHDLRRWSTDRHRTVDDRPFGGGAGMVFKPEPQFDAVEWVLADAAGREKTKVILTSPQGRPLDHELAAELASQAHLVILCGRYEGVDERVLLKLVDEEISIGDFVLSGGELASAVIVDAVCRLIPGTLGDEESAPADSFARGLLDYPHYTRPAEYRGLKVPEVLLSGNHEQIRLWRKKMVIVNTLRKRPDLLDRAELDEDDRVILEELRRKTESTGDEPV